MPETSASEEGLSLSLVANFPAEKRSHDAGRFLGSEPEKVVKTLTCSSPDAVTEPPHLTDHEPYVPEKMRRIQVTRIFAFQTPRRLHDQIIRLLIILEPTNRFLHIGRGEANDVGHPEGDSDPLVFSGA